jgi:CheY-like chemotaxis protein
MRASATLLVDDDQDTCAAVSDITADLGYPAVVACDDPAALALTRRQRYGLALLDKMPGVHGLELDDHVWRVHADTGAAQ